MFIDIVLAVAAFTAGLMAGVFWVYWHAIMPGLRRTDDRTFVGAFQSIDRAITNPMFLLCFIAPLPLSALAGVLLLGRDTAPALPWVVVAFVLYLVAVVLTMAVNVPLNNAIRAAGDPDGIADLAEVRRDFQEARWVSFNAVRTVLSVAAFGCLLGGLIAQRAAI